MKATYNPYIGSHMFNLGKVGSSTSIDSEGWGLGRDGFATYEKQKFENRGHTDDWVTVRKRSELS